MNFKHEIDLNHVDEAMLQSYRSLRRWIGLLAIAFPLILIFAGRLWGIEVQPTLSNYYFAQDPVTVDHTPVRLWFCGILFVVGFFLARYPGFTKHEEKWLNAAGIFALGVAIFPMAINGQDQYGFILAPLGLSQLSLHGICAVVAFVCIAIVIFWYSDATLNELETSDPSLYRRYRWTYRGIAAFMVLSIVTAVCLNYAHHGQGAYILAAEWCGIWAFAVYWFVKNSEMKRVGDALKARKALLPHRSPPDLAERL
ncbi:hypothetical protein [Bradyrhizobium sp.]|jgi:hypothetical protein|uniref:hypothetical protein n=1 Tax=Bradyrhizobium sp. TaxID=376 RepID=UPI003C4F5855